MYDVAIIGGGVIGCAIARELSRYRLRTVVLEMCEEVGFGTTKTNSGIIHAGHHSSPDTLKGRLVVRGNQLFDELCEELNFGFARIGDDASHGLIFIPEPRLIPVEGHFRIFIHSAVIRLMDIVVTPIEGVHVSLYKMGISLPDLGLDDVLDGFGIDETGRPGDAA